MVLEEFIHSQGLRKLLKDTICSHLFLRATEKCRWLWMDYNSHLSSVNGQRGLLSAAVRGLFFPHPGFNPTLFFSVPWKWRWGGVGSFTCWPAAWLVAVDSGASLGVGRLRNPLPFLLSGRVPLYRSKKRNKEKGLIV